MSTKENKELTVSSQRSAGDREFIDTLETLYQARDFLQQDVAGIPLRIRAGKECAAEAALTDDRLKTLQMERPSRTCALVLGEFKVGKSTLINALVGKTVAASDVFELTQVVCRIVPTPDATSEHVDLFWRNVAKPLLRLDLTDFLARAENRDLGDFSQATVYVRSPLDIVLVDTPGLGATRAHELDALNALGTADVALCVIDCESLGGGRDAATIARMQEIELPFICVLTKADVLAASDVSLVTEYITDNLGVPADRIFPVSAQQKIETGSELGLDRLQNFLHNAIGPKASELRTQSLLAQSRDIADAYALCLEYARNSIESVLSEIKDYADSLDGMAETVTKDLCSALSDMLHKRLCLQIENMRAGRKGVLSEDDFTEAIAKCFEGDAEKEFIAHLRAQIDSCFQDEWVEGFKSHLALLHENLRAMREEANEAATRDVARIIQNEELKQQAVSEATGAAISGAAVAVGAIAIGSFFLPGALFAVPFMVTAWQKFKKAQKHGEEAETPESFQARIDQWREEVINHMMQQFRPSLLALNRQVAEQAATNYAQKRSEWPVPFAQLDRLYKDAERIAVSLRN